MLCDGEEVITVCVSWSILVWNPRESVWMLFSQHLLATMSEKVRVLDARGNLALFWPSHIQIALPLCPSLFLSNLVLIRNHIPVPSHGICGFLGQFYQWWPLWYIYMHLHSWFSDNIEINKNLALLFSPYKLKGISEENLYIPIMEGT
jgi:hypothetical protein